MHESRLWCKVFFENIHQYLIEYKKFEVQMNLGNEWKFVKVIFAHLSLESEWKISVSKLVNVANLKSLVTTFKILCFYVKREWSGWAEFLALVTSGYNWNYPNQFNWNARFLNGIVFNGICSIVQYLSIINIVDTMRKFGHLLFLLFFSSIFEYLLIFWLDICRTLYNTTNVPNYWNSKMHTSR